MNENGLLMYNLDTIRNIHVELTTECQARCPMCPRRINGGPVNPLFDHGEIDLAKFQQWFPEHLLKQLDRIFLCGNLGDPIVARDCLEIIEHIRQTNDSINIGMHTNGSARNIQWWTKLAALRVQVVFGIDGLEDTHSLYRVSTDFNKIIDNATAFIKNGGQAEWHMLVFEHNEHQVEKCRQLSEQLGFSKFVTKHTSRFTQDKLNVINDQGQTVHVLYPSNKSRELSLKVLDAVKEQKPYIKCKAQVGQELYIGAAGNVSPCCWLDVKWHLPSNQNRIDYMDQIGQFPNLHQQSLSAIFDSGYFNRIAETWNKNPLRECSKQCGSFDKCGSQFN